MLFLALLLFPGLQAQGPASIPGLKIEPVSRELLQEIKERPMATREELAGSYRILPGASFARLRMEPSGNGPSLVRVLVGGIEEP
ncbi:MAG: hypothetical protein ACE5H3_12290, partial [Planctomycetota bacterium]